MLEVPGLSTAQVQALIDAALAGKGVIGTAVLAITSETVTVTFADGVLQEAAGTTYSWQDAAGRLQVNFVPDLADDKYNYVTTTNIEVIGPKKILLTASQLRVDFLNITATPVSVPLEIRLSILR